MKDFKLTSLLNAELEDSALNKVRGGNDSGCAAPKGSCKGTFQTMYDNAMSAMNSSSQQGKPNEFPPYYYPDTLKRDTIVVPVDTVVVSKKPKP